VDHRSIGDPCYGVAKIYAVSYRCGDGTLNSEEIPGEASGKTLSLVCPEREKTGISIISAIYGSNCDGSDQTMRLGDACNGRPSCEYLVDHRSIGDPCYGVAKIYAVSYRCGDGTLHSEEVPGEASGQTLKLKC